MIKTVLLDIDETLIYARGETYARMPSEEFKKVAVKATWQKESDYVLLRPSTIPFLKALKDRGYRLGAITQGVVPWQVEVFKATGIDEFIPVSEIYGWETIQRTSVRKPNMSEIGKWVVVDNHPMKGMLSRQKADWMGAYFDSSNYIVCPEWWGGEDDQPLTDLLPSIDKLLA